MSLADSAKDATKKLQDSASRAVAAAREKGQAMSLRRREDGLAEELGYIVFRQREGEAGLDAEIDRLVGEMRAVRAELEGLQE